MNYFKHSPCSCRLFFHLPCLQLPQSWWNRCLSKGNQTNLNEKLTSDHMNSLQDPRYSKQQNMLPLLLQFLDFSVQLHTSIAVQANCPPCHMIALTTVSKLFKYQRPAYLPCIKLLGHHETFCYQWMVALTHYHIKYRKKLRIVVPSSESPHEM